MGRIAKWLVHLVVVPLAALALLLVLVSAILVGFCRVLVDAVVSDG